MTDIARAVVQTWVPKGQGKGGEFSNCTPYDSDADTLIEVKDCVIESNAWVPRPVEVNPGTLPQLSGGVGGGTSQWGLPNVNSMELGNFYLGGTGLHASMYASVSTGGVYLIDPYAGQGTPAYKIRTSSSSSKWTFRLVKNRMYMANGVDRPTISSNPLYISNNGKPYPSSLNYTWGCNPPATAPSYQILPGAITTGSLSTVTNGGTAIVGLGTSFTSGVVGQTIFILGVAYTIVAITNDTHLTLGGGPNGDGTYAGSTGTVANGGWQINTGNLSWDAGAGFQYAYSYYDPATGHTSSTSPVLAVNDGPPNNGGVSVKLTNIQQLLDANGAKPDPRFTEIVIWRTGDNGGTLYSLDVLTNDPSVGGYPNSGQTPPFTYTDTTAGNTKLGVIRPGNFPAPTLSTNFPPPSDLCFITYAQGRFWGFSPSNPGLLIYSCRSDATGAEFPVGVAEECWPPTFTIPIPETDGVGTGTKLVGSNIYAETAKGIYAVAGSSPADYQLVLVSSKGNGTTHFSSTRLPGEDANSGDILVHFGNDGRLYYLYGAGGDIAYSYPIQDQLFVPSFNPSSNYMTAVMHNNQGTYLLLALNGDVVHAFDVERQVWFRWTLGNVNSTNGIYAMCEGLLGTSTVFFVANQNGIWALQAQPTASQIYFLPFILTQRFNPPGTDRFDQKILDSMYLYDVSGNTNWTANSLTDGKPLQTYVRSTGQTVRNSLSEPSELYYPREANPVLSIGRTFQLSWAMPVQFQTWKLAQITTLWAMKDESLAPG